MTTCKWSAPIYMSKPSFLDGSPSLRAAIDGLEEPSYDRHDSYLSVEVSGTRRKMCQPTLYFPDVGRLH